MKVIHPSSMEKYLGLKKMMVRFYFMVIWTNNLHLKDGVKDFIPIFQQ